MKLIVITLALWFLAGAVALHSLDEFYRLQEIDRRV